MSDNAMGLHSVELQDTYIRLGRNLIDLLSFLDKKVGRGRYLLFFTLD